MCPVSAAQRTLRPLARGLDSTGRPLADTAAGSSRPKRNYADENSPPKSGLLAGGAVGRYELGPAGLRLLYRQISFERLCEAFETMQLFFAHPTTWQRGDPYLHSSGCIHVRVGDATAPVRRRVVQGERPIPAQHVNDVPHPYSEHEARRSGWLSRWPTVPMCTRPPACALRATRCRLSFSAGGHGSARSMPLMATTLFAAFSS